MGARSSWFQRKSGHPQIEANRRNAQKSTGPRTDQGKATVAQNALKHGLYATNLLLPEEDPAKFEALRQLYYDNYQPSTLDEIDLIEAIIADRWELNRINLMKQGVFSEAREWMRHKVKNPTVEDICMETGRDYNYSRKMTRALQLEARIQRHCERCQRDLRKLQQDLRNQSRPELEVEAESDPAPGAAETAEPTRRPPQSAPPSTPDNRPGQTEYNPLGVLHDS